MSQQLGSGGGLFKELLYGAIGGIVVSDDLVLRLGNAVYWGYGMAWGAIYGVLVRSGPVKARGLPFGVAFWLVGDEIVTTVFAFTAPADGTYRILHKIGG